MRISDWSSDVCSSDLTGSLVSSGAPSGSRSSSSGSSAIRPLRADRGAAPGSSQLFRASGGIQGRNGGGKTQMSISVSGIVSEDPPSTDPAHGQRSRSEPEVPWGESPEMMESVASMSLPGRPNGTSVPGPQNIRQLPYSLRKGAGEGKGV